MLPRYSISLAKLRLESFPMSEFFLKWNQKKEKKRKDKKKYKQEIKERSKINKRRLVKVTPPLKRGDIYIQNCVVKVSLLHLSVKSSIRVSSSPALGAPAVIPACRTLRRGCCSVWDVLASPAGTPGRCWAWRPGPAPSPLCGGAWLLSQAATGPLGPCWPEGPLWALGAPYERAASVSDSSGAPDRPDPWLLSPH